MKFSIDSHYVRLINEILSLGTNSDDRTGVGTVSMFGAMLETDLSNNALPAISVRKVAPRWAFEELMFMLNGKSQTKELEEKGINIWKGNTTREFLDARGLSHVEEGDFGPMYGVQLREFFAVSDSRGTSDQLRYMHNEIINNPTSRRIIATHYNPSEVHLGALFPCHIMTQFNVRDGKLDCLFWMRSSDVGFGLPYNLMYYAMFTHMMAKLCGLEAGNLVYQAGDCHIYKDQIESGMINYMKGNLTSDDNKITIPKFIINKEYSTLEEMLELKWEDIEIVDYNPYPDFKKKPKMAV
jgi:thymidylate synthase